MHVATIDATSPGAPALLAESLHTTGFAMLVDHPLDPGLIRQVQAEWLAFFTSGAARRYLAGPGHQDGYHPLSTAETAVGAAVPDAKEYFHWFAWGRHPSEVSDAAAVLHRRATDLAATLLGWLDGQIPASCPWRRCSTGPPATCCASCATRR